MLHSWTFMPFLSSASNMLIHLPSPMAISFWWNLGSFIGMLMMIQILTGWLLTFSYINNSSESFDSVWLLHLDSWHGCMIHWIHMNGASFLFFFIYLHLLKGLYLQSWKFNTLVWTTGFILMILCMASAFLGYVLPFGQMSLWGATVICNLMSVISPKLVIWVWSGYSVNPMTLQLFFTMHYAVPFMVLAMVMIHLTALHTSGSTHFSLKIEFWPIFIIKDMMNLVGLSLLLWWTLKLTYLTSDPDNFSKADPSSSPLHIKPEWYFLQYYAILRSIPNKLIGVMMFIMSLIMLLLLTTVSDMEDESWSVLWSMFVSQFCMINLMLIKVGGKAVETPFLELGQWLTCLYFSWFLVNLVLPSTLAQKKQLNTKDLTKSLTTKQ